MAVRLDQLCHVSKCRNPLALELGTEPTAGVKFLELCQCQVGNSTTPVGRTVDRVIMNAVFNSVAG